MIRFYYKWKINKELGDRWRLVIASMASIKNVAKSLTVICQRSDADFAQFAVGYDACILSSYCTRDKFTEYFESLDERYVDRELCEIYRNEVNKIVTEIEAVLSPTYSELVDKR